MSNYAALIDVLSIAGSRKSDGTANASGTIWFFQPGTNTQVNAYSDAAATTIITQPVTLTSGGLLNRADFPAGIYVTQPVRIFVQDTSLNTVVDTVYVPATAGDVGVNNDGFTDSTLDAALTKAFTSFGGQDWTYLESLGATARTIKTKFSEIWISVKDFGAVGDGVAIDTTAIQAAMNRVKALGGGICYFPPGTYLIDQALILNSATGITLLGVRGATTVKSNHGTANAFTFGTSSTSCAIEGITITNTATSAGNAISVTTGSDFAIRDVVTDSFYADAFFVTGVSNWFIQSSYLFGNTFGLESTASAGTRPNVCFNTQLGKVGSTAAVKLDGSAGDHTFIGGVLWGSVGIDLTGGYTGGPLAIFGTRNQATTAYANLTGVDKGFRFWGTTVDGTIISQASGGGGGSSFTPNRLNGQDQHIRLTSGGAAILTVNAPTPVAGTLAGQKNIRLTIRVTAAAGGNITARFNAVYKIVGGGTDIVVVDTNTQVVEFAWEDQTGLWRECFRAVSAT